MPASPGLADGPIFVLAEMFADERAAGTPEDERAALKGAIAEASTGIADLMGQSGEEGAAILEFQLAMLEDDALAEPAYEMIAAGASALAGWRAAMDAQITGFETADDDYFRARAADLADIRDRVTAILTGSAAQTVPPGSVVAGEDITPSRFLQTDWSRGGAIVLGDGSPSSHVAILARARGVPMVTGIGKADFASHRRALVDGGTGNVVLSPDGEAEARYRERCRIDAAQRHLAEAHLLKPAVLADGERVQVMVNIAAPEDVDAIDIASCDGVGLMRSEFLFHGETALPDEKAQYLAYRKVLEWASGKPVTIRTLDAGGDKPVQGLTVEEANPFLGLRGIRLSLTRPDVFKSQLRALARAAVYGDLKVMLPMVTVPEEIDEAARLLDGCLAELIGEGVPAKRPQLGIMIEVPAVAILPERFARAAFFSIGSNDLSQYVTAAARDSSAVARLNTAGDPAVLHLIAHVAGEAKRLGIPLSLCGDAGSDPVLLPALLSAGLRTLSVAPTALGRVKSAISQIRP
ncbi:phosphoenolpyruvate--protein phosphotransferase [Stappia albiluteola]|nr:phosphoenolpyruvate--protein phosphotransferase [Stappia albiluteola]